MLDIALYLHCSHNLLLCNNSVNYLYYIVNCKASSVYQMYEESDLKPSVHIKDNRVAHWTSKILFKNFEMRSGVRIKAGYLFLPLKFKFKFQVSSLFKLIYYKFMTSKLQSLEYETYDVPLLAVSYSYSRRAVV